MSKSASAGTWRRASEVPEYDGWYQVFIYEKQECGTTWGFQKVVCMNHAKWKIADNQEVIYWRHLFDSPEIMHHVFDVSKTFKRPDESATSYTEELVEALNKIQSAINNNDYWGDGGFENHELINEICDEALLNHSQNKVKP